MTVSNFGTVRSSKTTSTASSTQILIPSVADINTGFCFPWRLPSHEVPGRQFVAIGELGEYPSGSVTRLQGKRSFLSRSDETMLLQFREGLHGGVGRDAERRRRVSDAEEKLTVVQ